MSCTVTSYDTGLTHLVYSTRWLLSKHCSFQVMFTRNLCFKQRSLSFKETLVFNKPVQFMSFFLQPMTCFTLLLGRLHQLATAGRKQRLNISVVTWICGWITVQYALYHLVGPQSTRVLYQAINQSETINLCLRPAVASWQGLSTVDWNNSWVVKKKLMNCIGLLETRIFFEAEISLF